MTENPVFTKSSMGLFFYFLESNKIKIIILITLCIILGMVPSIKNQLISKIINIMDSSPNNITDFASSMLLWPIIYALWCEVGNITWRVYDYLYLKTIPRIKGQIVDTLYNYTQYHSYKFSQDNLAGHIANRITETARSFELIAATFGEKIIRKIAVIIFALITMYSIHNVFVTIFLIWIALSVVVNMLCMRRINQYSINYARNKSIVAGNIVDSIVNISAVRMFTAHKLERQYLNVRIKNAVASEQVMQFFMCKLHYVLGLFCSIMIFTIVYYLTLLRNQMAITIGDCVLILNLTVAVIDDTWDLTQEIGDLFEEIGAFNQGMSLMVPHIITDIENAKTLEVSVGKIIFKNITFKYQHNDYLFKNQSIIIPGAQKVGLVGFSGSGKTTFANLIIRLHDINAGEILIDDQNIRTVTQDSLRKNISFIPQESILFHRTIIDNIRYGKPEASKQEVIESARAAYIDDFIMSLAQGYDSLCGERGNNFSGGQRQRIIIARAILKNAPILILDEATSSLDSESENFIQKSLQYLMQNKTVLVIAHRLHTLLNMDRILVFNQGTIIEDGTHQELLKNGTLYNKLWQSQIKNLVI